MDPNDNIPAPDDIDPIAAMEAGIAAATAAAPEPVADVDLLADVVADDAAGDAAAAKPEGEGEPAADAIDAPADAKPEGDKPADAKPGDKPLDAAKPERDEAVEKEIAERGLQGKTADRFRELSAEVKELAPMREALTAAGIKSPDELQQQLKWVKDGQDLIGMVTQTGATPDQYGMALDALTLVSRANAGDLAAGEEYFKLIEGEYLNMAKFLGKKVPGVDPLADFPDLRGDVDELRVTEDRAIEIAQHRRAQAATKQVQEKSEQQTQQQTALDSGRVALNTLGAELAAADPAYAAKVPYLLPTLEVIKSTMPPGQWAEAARKAYAKIPAPPKAAPTPEPPKPKPVPGPVRPSGPRPQLVPEFDDPAAAMEAGIAAASGGYTG